MSETLNQNNKKNDEIDLLDLFRRMGRGIVKLSGATGRAILVSIVFLLKRWLPLGLSVLLGIGISYGLKYLSPSFFTSDLVLRVNSVSTTADMIAYVNRLHTYCREKNMTALAEAISLSPAQVKDILDISAAWIIDEGRDGIPDQVDFKNKYDVFSDSLVVRMQDRFNIRVRTIIPKNLYAIRNGIIKFINSDSLFQQRNRVRLRQNKELLTRLDYDILQLDSLQKVIIKETEKRQPDRGGQMIFLQQQNTQLVYPDIYKLHSQKQSLEQERDLYRDIVTILSEFTIPAKRINGGSFYAIKIVPAFFIITLLILIVLANRKKLSEIYNKY